MLRTEKLGELAVAFAQRDMGQLEAAALLECSASAARSYLFELLDAGVIRQKPQAERGKPVYRLSYDGASPAAAVDNVEARRDPLVAALFGAPPPRNHVHL